MHQTYCYPIPSDKTYCFKILIVAAVITAAGQVRAADAPPANKPTEAQLIGVLQSDAAPAEKAKACKALALCGTGEAVPALAALLSDEHLASWARIALEAIPGPAPDDALRQSLGALRGNLLVGAINSLGARKDPKAVEPLAGLLRGTDADTAAAAAVALGRIGRPEAIPPLKRALSDGFVTVRSAAAEGCILCAEKWEQSPGGGHRENAIELYDAVLKADVPKPRILEATRGAILARGADGIPMLLEQLRSPDRDRLHIGLSAARELPGVEATDALLAELDRATPDRQGLILLALADRGDRKILSKVLETARNGATPARIAAMRVLLRMGNVHCVPVLLDGAAADEALVAKTAMTVLEELPGAAVDADLSARLPKAEGRLRLALLELAGLRCLKDALPELLKAADDADDAVRAAGLTALGAVVEMPGLAFLIERTANPPRPSDAKPAEAALRAACTRMPDREACAAVLAGRLTESPAAAKKAFLSILTEMGGQKALETVAAAARDASDAELQDAASRLLGEWMSVDAAPVLLELARSAPEERYQIRALRGYIRIARQLELPAEDRVAMCGEALKVCRRDNERNLAIEVLRRNPSKKGLALVMPFVENAELKTEAVEAALTIAEKIIADEPAAAAAAMQRILAVGGDPKTLDRAKALADRAAREKSGTQ